MSSSARAKNQWKCARLREYDVIEGDVGLMGTKLENIFW